jgi:hypothetical protein
MRRSNYIDDGCTLPGFIAAVPLLYEDLRFTFRPALVGERSQLADVAAEQKPEAYDRRAAALLAQKLVAWDVVDRHGNEVDITAASILRLQPELFLKLHRIVLGRIASDVDPQWSDDRLNQLAGEELDASMGGKTIGEIREEAYEKN